MNAIEREFEELVDAVVPAVISLEELELLVRGSEADAVDAECLIHEGCRAIG